MHRMAVMVSSFGKIKGFLAATEGAPSNPGINIVSLHSSEWLDS